MPRSQPALLAREAARVVDAVIEGLARALQAVDAHRGGDVGGACEPLRAGKRQPEQRGRGLGAVDERETFFRTKDDRVQTHARQRVPTRLTRPTRNTRLALSDQHEGEVRQRSQIAARPDGPA